MATNDALPLFPADRYREALSALGVRGLEEQPVGGDPVFLLGVLLALTETHVGRLERIDLLKVFEGFMSALMAFSGDDPHKAAQCWAVVLGNRINRTSVELHTGVAGEGKLFTDVADPAMLVAADLLSLVNRSRIDQETLARTLTVIEDNLSAARRKLETMREALREQGFDL
ncbi:hypothetical protein ACSMTC_35165 [Kitasatospora sp. HPMI-4]